MINVKRDYERASAWADRLVGTVERVWSPNTKPGGYFHGTIACLSALFHAGARRKVVRRCDEAAIGTTNTDRTGMRRRVAQRQACAGHFATRPLTPHARIARRISPSGPAGRRSRSFSCTRFCASVDSDAQYFGAVPVPSRNGIQ